MQSTALATIDSVHPSDCSSVRHSPVSVSKRLKLCSWGLHWMVAPWL